ncbi:3-oxoacyl-[acyl-carrier-protein] reductase FabG-like [Melitaea cinxia]|uniref:3-oxoacyl-[acyl-carrier-protein] reductase FabG-like n=1 Tax=Melitaea cinxia TaxID=113334 RepID=UPI001E274110|nr:3-oxoacyl-[acyl-carrier-protein] reductase FabG-like [Melitaea cinxia]
MLLDLKNKVVIITGASSGIGAAAAKLFSGEGARVVMVGRNEKKLSAVAARCASPLVILADVSKDDDARRIISETVKKFGQIDVLVNNAGLSVDNGGLLGNDMMQAYDAVMRVNLRAVVFLTTLAAPHLIMTKGNIVNISSIAGKMAISSPDMINYYVSKAALDHFTVCSAAELGPHGVRVNGVNPGPVRTDFLDNAKMSITWDDVLPKTLLNRVSEAEEIADLIMFLASDRAKGITGAHYVTDNGMLVKRF